MKEMIEDLKTKIEKVKKAPTLGILETENIGK